MVWYSFFLCDARRWIACPMNDLPYLYRPWMRCISSCDSFPNISSFPVNCLCLLQTMRTQVNINLVCCSMSICMYVLYYTISPGLVAWIRGCCLDLDSVTSILFVLDICSLFHVGLFHGRQIPVLVPGFNCAAGLLLVMVDRVVWKLLG